jgi:hypothetical protein
MEIRPTDLGLRRGVPILSERARSMQNMRRGGRLAGAIGAAQKKRLGTLGRWWLRGSGLDDETGAEVLHAMRGPLLGLVGGFCGGFGGAFGINAIAMTATSLLTANAGPGPVLAAVFGAIGAAGVGVGLGYPRTLVQHWIGTPLSEGELDMLLATHPETGLERRFLNLVREAIRVENAPEKVTEELRAAIQTLGAAIDTLPPLSEETMALNPETLRAEALALRERSLAETDRVVADSVERRANALEQQADAIGHSAQAIRRNVAQREELDAQLEALRLGLVAYYSGGQSDSTGLVQLATSARAVAGETQALASATAELDAGPQRVKLGR